MAAATNAAASAWALASEERSRAPSTLATRQPGASPAGAPAAARAAAAAALTRSTSAPASSAPPGSMLTA
ncbi:MAG TPA: hypothetical protein OIL86_15485 [Eggerthellaceae bacterium]|nr:hypothetical protein [Eggerthellaceae bacterium]